MRPAILSASEYEARIFDALTALGFPAHEAREILRRRMPLDADGVLAELQGRGLGGLCLADMTAFLRQRYGRNTFDDGEPLVAEALAWPPRLIEAFVGFCLEHGRGEPAEEPPELVTVVSLAEMLRQLRSPDPVARLIAATCLAAGLGAGFAVSGEHAEDVEHLLAPQVSALLGRAAAGDAAAVDFLEAVVTSEPPARTRKKANQ